MTAIVFSTPGELDLKALTTFGLNSKPNTANPIGYFGTGLKYAIAVLVRNQIPVTLYIGDRQYEFYVRNSDFRDKQYGHVMMRQRNSLFAKWRYVELPFTTELGKNWQLWQAFRELEANTRDEGGLTCVIEQADKFDTFAGAKVGTKVVVHGQGVAGEQFVDCYHNRDEIFLPGGLTFREGDKTVQVFEKASNYLYYRGLRVMELPKPSTFTYNILSPLTLTEDRTVTSSWDVERALTTYVAQCTDPATVAKILDAPDTSFEATWSFDYIYCQPSDVFKDVLAKKRSRRANVLPSAIRFFDRMFPPVDDIPIDCIPLSTQLSNLCSELNSRCEITDDENELLDKCIKALAKQEVKDNDEIPF